MIRFSRFIALIVVLTAAPVCAQEAPEALHNLDFETGAPGEVPPGWSFPDTAVKGGFLVQLTDETAHGGRQSVLIDHTNWSTVGRLGSLSKKIDAAPYRGKRVRFRAAVRTEVYQERGEARLWLRVDREGGRQGFFDNMEKRPIASPEWQIYEIIGDVADDAASIHLGTMLMGYGKSWTDDVVFEIIGEAEPLVVEAPRPVTERGLANLTAFTRLLGYVRYFHPSDEAAETDWDAFAVAGIRAVEDADDALTLATRLEALFCPIAPTVRAMAHGTRVAPLDASFPRGDDLQLVRWTHFGVGAGSVRSIYKSTREKQDVPEGLDPADIYNEDLAHIADLGSVSVLVPRVLFADAQGTLPRGARLEQPETTRSYHTGDDRATRLAAVALAWNVFQHFYPYFDVVETDWEAALQTALADAATDPDEVAFEETLQRLVAALHDGHGRVSGPGPDRSHSPPFVWEWVEEQLVITHVADSAEVGVSRGDVVLEIDGAPVAEALAAVEALISGATPQWIRYRALNDLRRGPKDSPLSLRVQSTENVASSITVTRTLDREQAPREPRPETVDELEPGIFYVDLDRITTKAFNEALPRLEKADGIVFDLRGYPRRIQPVFIQHLIDEPVQSAHWLVPEVERPDRDSLTFNAMGRWRLDPLTPYLTARRAFVTDGRAISYAESCLGIIEHYKLAEIVGAPTAGTNGNVNSFTLPGGYRISWTGMKVIKHDGSQHHGVGILPTIPATRTRQGIREGRDELLERAVEAVRGE